MLKDLLFIPGRGKQVGEYNALTSDLRAIGWRIAPITMDWSEPIRDVGAVGYAEQALKQTQGHVFDAVGGFSVGGASTLVAASRLVEAGYSPEIVLFCSPSALFADDLHLRPDADPNLPVDPFVSSIDNSPKPIATHILYGAEEMRSIRSRSRKLGKHLGIVPIPIPNTLHDVEAPRYRRRITALLAA